MLRKTHGTGNYSQKIIRLMRESNNKGGRKYDWVLDGISWEIGSCVWISYVIIFCVLMLRFNVPSFCVSIRF